MASNLSRGNINFIKLNQEELSTKIALLASQKSRIIFWKKAPRYYEGKVFSFNFHLRKTYLTINDCNIHLRLVGERICLNFSINDIEYFLRGKVFEQLEDNLQMTIELEEYCFRVEKRSKERLISYPLYEVYAYLKYQKLSNANVIFLNKKEEKERSFFSEIDNLQKSKLRSMSAELSIEDTEDLAGFRVEDISSSGLSFFANAKEKENIIDALMESKFSLTLNFEMQVFNLEEAYVTYKISYINSQFSGIPMYKIGITFKSSPSLKRKIEDISGITIDLFDYQKDFEEFIKNE